MGVIVGLLLGAGVLLIWLSLFERPKRATPMRLDPLRDELALAGWYGTSTVAFLALSELLGLATALLGWLATGSVAVGLVFGVLAGFLPSAIVSARARRRRALTRTLWPDVIDDLLSGIRAGMSLPEAVVALAERGPEELRPAFRQFAADYGTTANFSRCLDLLKDRFANPVADRVIEALRLTREVGGTDLGRTLRTLAGMLREDQRTRGELLSRQSWTINAARLAVAAPWVVLALLALRADSLAAFDSPQGIAVLVGGAGACVIAYLLMMRIGRLPEDRRVLR